MHWLDTYSSWSDLTSNTFSVCHDSSTQFLCFFSVLSVGIVGLVFRSNDLLTVLIFGELILVSLVFGFTASALYLNDPSGGIYALIILNLAAVESSIGMVLVLNLFKVCGGVGFDRLRYLRG